MFKSAPEAQREKFLLYKKIKGEVSLRDEKFYTPKHVTSSHFQNELYPFCPFEALLTNGYYWKHRAGYASEQDWQSELVKEAARLNEGDLGVM